MVGMTRLEPQTSRRGPGCSLLRYRTPRLEYVWNNFMVGMTRLELATSRPPAVRATNCATPRHLAEGWGFEPQINFAAYTRFPSVLLQPLGHPSLGLVIILAHLPASA